MVLGYEKAGRPRDFKRRGPRLFYRALEILPGALIWSSFALIILGALYFPGLLGIFAIAFYTYWLLKVFYFMSHLGMAYRNLRNTLKVNWGQKLNDLPAEAWLKNFPDLNKSTDVWQVVTLPMYKESFEVVKGTFEALLKSDYPLSKIIIGLGVEDRAGALALETAKRLKALFAKHFGHFIITQHPINLPDEIAGKGSNETFIARQVYQQIIYQKNLNLSHILYSALDVDTQLEPGYFSLLTHTFLTSPKPHQQSYQPIAFFSNNIWQAPAIARVVAFSSTYWNIIQQERPHRQVTFSTHSMSFKTLVDIDYKVVNAVSDDSRVFWQCFFKFKGSYTVKSLFYPIHMDANVASTFWRTMRNQYLQQRRWAWGVSDIAYAGTNLLHSWPQFSAKQRRHALKRLGAAAIGYYSWATSSLLVFLLGWLPSWLGGAAYNQTVFSYNLPNITQGLATLASTAVILQVFLTLRILPPKPPRFGRHRYILMILQWALLPITMNLLGAVPAIDAQTRLMLGKRLGFWATEKYRQ